MTNILSSLVLVHVLWWTKDSLHTCSQLSNDERHQPPPLWILTYFPRISSNFNIQHIPKYLYLSYISICKFLRYHWAIICILIQGTLSSDFSFLKSHILLEFIFVTTNFVIIWITDPDQNKDHGLSHGGFSHGFVLHEYTSNFLMRSVPKLPYSLKPLLSILNSEQMGLGGLLNSTSEVELLARLKKQHLHFLRGATG